ncbi:MAG TPA: 30S ribosomal protein S21 [Kiritimatiellae bacterium]|nr:30S ribosomal protein S21 [Kiritimatiellia bacterium]
MPFVLKGVITTPIAEVRLKKGESVDRAIKRLKKKLDKEGIMREIRMHRHYEKPSERRRRKAARAKARARG